MKPITIKGGDYMPRPKRQIMHELRPKFKLRESDYKSLQRAIKIMNISMSEWVRIQVERSLGSDI